MSKIDTILQRAYESLDLFYAKHGDSDEKPTTDVKPKKTYNYQKTIICRYPGCTQEITVNGGRSYCPTHSDLKARESQIKYENKRGSKRDLSEASPKNVEVMFKGMGAKDIIKYVKEKTGYQITVSVKSKKSVIRHALNKLNDYGYSVKSIEPKAIIKVIETKPKIKRITHDISVGNQVSLIGKSAKEIIDIVKEKTGHHITICVKSKGSVIRHAILKLKEKGFSVLLK